MDMPGVDAYAVLTIVWDSERVNNVHKNIRGKLSEHPRFQNEYEYLKGAANPDITLIRHNISRNNSSVVIILTQNYFYTPLPHPLMTGENYPDNQSHKNAPQFRLFLRGFLYSYRYKQVCH